MSHPTSSSHRQVRPFALCALVLGLLFAGLSAPASAAAPTAQPSAQPRVVAGSNGTWSALGPGLSGTVFAMAKSDDTIYIGGFLFPSGGLTFNNLAAWSVVDNTYSTLGSGVDSIVWTLAVGADDSVYIGGSFTNYSGLAKWDASARVLSRLGPGVNGAVNGLTIYDDTLYIGGSFNQKGVGGSANDLPRIAQWGPLTGATPAISKVGVGVGNNTVQAVHVPRNGGYLYLGGDFSQKYGGSFMDLPKFAQFGPLANNPALSPVGPGITNSVVLAVNSSRDDTVFLGGSFTPAGLTTLRKVGAWNPGSSTYSSLGYGLFGTDGVFSIAVDDTHSLVYVGGDITYACGPLANCPSADDTVALNGVGVFDLRTQDWVPLLSTGGSGLNGNAYALVLDDSSLYLGGSFSASKSGTPLSNVAKWTWDPPSGNATILHSGASSIAIPGQSFVGVTGVTIGGIPAAIDYTQSSSTQLTVAVPALPTGNHPIVVTAVGGTATAGTYSIPVPSTPVVTASAGQTSIDLAWTLDDTGGSAVTYQVALGTTSNVVQSTTNTTATVTGLNPSTAYSAYVRAINNNGPGPWSAPATVTTTTPPPPPIPASPPGAPTGVGATPGNASAAVSWAPPADPGTYPIDGYIVRAQPGNQTCSTASTSCTVTGLNNGTPYTFTVTASSPAGLSPTSSASASVTPRTVPAAPTGVAATPGIAAAMITWDPPADDGGSVITGYQVKTIPASSGCQTAETKCTITGLTNGQEYTVSVVALNAAGASTPSSSVSVTPRAQGSIIVTGSRTGKQEMTVIVRGVVQDLDVSQVQFHYRLSRERSYRSTTLAVSVIDSGFTWQRSTGKRVSAYAQVGNVTSNRVVITQR